MPGCGRARRRDPGLAAARRRRDRARRLAAADRARRHAARRGDVVRRGRSSSACSRTRSWRSSPPRSGASARRRSASRPGRCPTPAAPLAAARRRRRSEVDDATRRLAERAHRRDDRRRAARDDRPRRRREPRAGPLPTAVSDTLLRTTKSPICRAFLVERGDLSSVTETDYTAKDITVLEGLEPVRLRPGMYIGSTGPARAPPPRLRGRRQRRRRGARRPQRPRRRHDPPRQLDHRASTRARGIPVDMIEEQGLPALTVVLTKLHAGGKFGGDGYKVSGGLHGVGVSVVNALSEWLVAEVRRDGKLYRQEFARGVPQGDMEDGRRRPRAHGTTITFLPDREIFEETEFSASTLAQRLRETAFLTRASADRAARRAAGRHDAGVPLRGRHQRLRLVHQRVEGPGAQARRLLRGRERAGRRRGRDAVEHLVRRVDLHRSRTTSTRPRAARTSPASRRR